MRIALSLCLSLGLLAAPLAAQDLTIERSGATLQGTLLTQVAPSALAMILPGSGPTDRNGNALPQLSTNAYLMLAEALTAQGIATLRADKRGVGDSTGDGNAVTLGIYAEDAGAFIDRARAETNLPCLWLIGHSEGGLVALDLARRRSDICGVILMATPGRPVSQILLEQLRAAPGLGPHLNAAEDIILSLVLGTPVPVERVPPVLRGVFDPRVQPFLIDLFAFNPEQVAQDIDLPALVIQGTADLQIGAEDAARLYAALPTSTLFEVPGMTHMLKQAADDSRAANLATYADPTRPLAPGLSSTIVAFIRAAR